ncbi:hypothetical protein J6590_038824 [Homalodisca vitripennis]|nr:hypothetical protein J6590_038824 [Homalodisca vitripennis]
MWLEVYSSAFTGVVLVRTVTPTPTIDLPSYPTLATHPPLHCWQSFFIGAKNRRAVFILGFKNDRVSQSLQIVSPLCPRTMRFRTRDNRPVICPAAPGHQWCKCGQFVNALRSDVNAQLDASRGRNDNHRLQRR